MRPPSQDSLVRRNATGGSHERLVRMLVPHAEAISAFVGGVERLAEEKMLLTHKLEGAHYAAMTQLRDKIIEAASAS